MGDPLALGRYVRPWNALPNGRQPIATHARMNSSKGLEKRPQHGLASSVSFQQAFGRPSPKRQRRERRLRTSWRRRLATFRSRHAFAMYAQRGSGTLLIAERLALERLDRLWGYPDDIVTAAESLWREAAKAVRDSQNIRRAL